MGGAILDWPMTFRGFALNSIRTGAGNLASDLSQAGNFSRVDRFDFSRLALRDQRDALHLRTGGDFGVVNYSFRFISLVGKVSGFNDADLEDRIASLLQAFNVENALREGYGDGNPDGTYQLTFSTPTALAGYTPRVSEYFLCRPSNTPVVYERRSTGLAQVWAVELVCADTRRYLFTQTSVIANAALTWTRKLPNWGTVQDTGPGAAVYPKLHLILTGAGASNLTLSPSIGVPLVLDLASIGAGSHVVDIDMALQTVYVDGVPAANRRTSYVDSWWNIPRGGLDLTVTNRTNLTSVTATYNEARM